MTHSLTWALLGAAIFGAVIGAPLEFYAFLTTFAGVVAGMSTRK